MKKYRLSGLCRSATGQEPVDSGTEQNGQRQHQHDQYRA
jgi:hypothetical protein